ncbi:MAG TPA: DinB family protein [Candidatus Angelobacter sp.]|nr:DinB family protein [Candidatus Angelobacter sp.]
MSPIATGNTLMEHVLYILNGDGAHADLVSAVDNVPVELRGKRPHGGAHSPWELLEHMRITQRDVLDSILHADHVSPDFPAGYWPATQGPENEAAWTRSAKEFQSDFKMIVELVAKKSSDLLVPLPHAKEQTILRKLLMLADHTSYHVGQLVLVRKLLGVWVS